MNKQVHDFCRTINPGYDVLRLKTFVIKHPILAAKVMQNQWPEEADYWKSIVAWSPGFVAGWLHSAMKKDR